MTLHYRVAGAGDPVVLIHGIGRSMADWDHVVEQLRHRYRVWVVDLPGFGDSDPLAGHHNLVSITDAVRDFLDQQAVSAAHVVGNSLGGAVAMQLAVTAPAQVRSLTLADSAGFGRQVTWALRALATPGLGRLILLPGAAGARRLEPHLYSDPGYATAERVATAARLAAHPHQAKVSVEVARALGSIRGVREDWRSALLPRVRDAALPTLVIWGSKDRVFPVQQLSEAKRLLPHSRTVELPGAGHLPQIEQPQAFVEAIEQFWTETSAHHDNEES